MLGRGKMSATSIQLQLESGSRAKGCQTSNPAKKPKLRGPNNMQIGHLLGRLRSRHFASPHTVSSTGPAKWRLRLCISQHGRLVEGQSIGSPWKGRCLLHQNPRSLWMKYISQSTPWRPLESSQLTHTKYRSQDFRERGSLNLPQVA